ncbi:hypothetical protein BDZ89DRAFT_1066121, partial [Hymenopellis radicata]
TRQPAISQVSLCLSTTSYHDPSLDLESATTTAALDSGSASAHLESDFKSSPWRQMPTRMRKPPERAADV